MDTLPLIQWMACTGQFIVGNPFSFDHAVIEPADAVRHFENGTAAFAKNAAREVKILAAFYRIERLNREFSYRVSFLQAEGSSLENACNIAQEEIDEAVAARRAL